MESINKYLFGEKEKTLAEKCKATLAENPQIMYKGIPAAIVAWYAVPMAMTACMWLPWVYVGHQVYTANSKRQRAKEWWDWIHKKLNL